MIETAFAQAQLMRLTGLDFFPISERDAAYRRELVKALCEYSLCDQHAVAIVDLCLRYCTKTPKPAELCQYAGQTAERFQMRRSGECTACQGTGFARVWILRTHEGNGHYREERITHEQYAALQSKVHGIGVQHVSEGVERCHECNYGRRLAVAEQTERQAS